VVDFANMTSENEGRRWASRPDGDFFGLTPRRVDVFKDWVLGMSIGQTAEHLVLAENTVKTYRSDITECIRDRCSGGFPGGRASGTLTRMAMTRAVIRCVADRSIKGVDVPEGVRLTAREAEVSGLMLQGMNTEEVAKRPGFSNRAAEADFRNIYSKLGLGDLRAEKYVPAVARLVVLAMKHGAEGNNSGNS